MKLLFAAFVTFVVACSSSPALSPSAGAAYTEHLSPVGNVPEVVPVWIDRRFSDQHREAIHSAFEQWNIALNGYEQFNVVSDTFDMDVGTLQSIADTNQGLVVLRHSIHDAIMEDLPEGVLGWVVTDLDSEAHAVHLVEDVVGNRDLSSIAMHEIGHTLRLPHLPVRGTLMFPQYRYGSSCIDQVTAQALATVRGWNWHLLNWCPRPL